jgi:hypothetical protein
MVKCLHQFHTPDDRLQPHQGTKTAGLSGLKDEEQGNRKPKTCQASSQTPQTQNTKNI